MLMKINTYTYTFLRDIIVGIYIFFTSGKYLNKYSNTPLAELI